MGVGVTGLGRRSIIWVAGSVAMVFTVAAVAATVGAAAAVFLQQFSASSEPLPHLARPPFDRERQGQIQARTSWEREYHDLLFWCRQQSGLGAHPERASPKLPAQAGIEPRRSGTEGSQVEVFQL